MCWIQGEAGGYSPILDHAGGRYTRAEGRGGDGDGVTALAIYQQAPCLNLQGQIGDGHGTKFSYAIYKQACLSSWGTLRRKLWLLSDWVEGKQVPCVAVALQNVLRPPGNKKC